MPEFTIISKRKVYRATAKSVQALTKALRASGIVWQAIHEDKVSTYGSAHHQAR